MQTMHMTYLSFQLPQSTQRCHVERLLLSVLSPRVDRREASGLIAQQNGDSLGDVRFLVGTLKDAS